jgi:2'-hydroxyisoflavone reductase
MRPVLDALAGHVFPVPLVLPWPEDTPYGPHPVWGSYATKKIGCDVALRERRPAPLSTVVIRLPLVLGPGNYIAREDSSSTDCSTRPSCCAQRRPSRVHQYVWIHHAAQALAHAVELDGLGEVQLEYGAGISAGG